MLRFIFVAMIATLIQHNYFHSPAQASDLAEPILVLGTKANDFEDMIRECAAEEGINFNHNFTVCTTKTTGAQANFLINRKTGEVKLIMTSELGIEVSPDSDIMVVNPYFWMSEGDAVPAWLWRKFYKYEDNTGEFILIGKNQEQNPKPEK